MAKPDRAAVTKEALRQRLWAASIHIVETPGSPYLTTPQLLAFLAKTVRDEGNLAKYWLLFTAVSGAMPTRDELIRGYRMLQLARAGSEHLEVLEATAGAASINDNFHRTIKILHDTVVVDVDFCARHGHNTGVQRVVRETMKRWAPQHEMTLAAWTQDGYSMRSLLEEEQRRVLRWTSPQRGGVSAPDVEDRGDLLVPWNCRLLLPEVAQHRLWERLSCLAEFSTNAVAMIGYDAIPVSSAEYVMPDETNRFVRYLSIVKHADLIIGISDSSAEEFAGFASALQAQAISGPRVVTVHLPVDASTPEFDASVTPRESSVPLVICVGTQEPRKNQLAVLAASEALWREGMAFELLFIGGAAMPLSLSFDTELSRLRKVGYKARVVRNATDAYLHQALRDSRFSVFVSMHEGFGLPVAESLAEGTPVITTNYGSTAEIAAGGGCILVDPRSDDEIISAMRTLLTDDALLKRLQSEAAAREVRTWDNYADEIWETLSSLEVAP